MKMEEYKNEIEEKFDKCDILTSNQDTTLKNSEGTSIRKAYKGLPWIYYWRAMIGFRLGTIKCSSCGKEIYTGLTALVKQQTMGDKVKEHIAEGGHVWMPTPKDNSYKGGWYIPHYVQNVTLREESIFPS